MIELYADYRILGNYGMGRYAREVLSRLTIHHERFTAGARPLSPREVVNPWRLALPRESLFYTPAFNAGFSRCRQLITLHDLIHLRQPASHARKLLWEGYYENIVRPIVKRSGAVISTSRTAAEEVRTWLRDDDVIVHACGVGLSSAFTVSVSEQREEFFLFVGNSKPHKNFETVLQALLLVDAARLVAVVPDVQACAALVAKHGLGDRVVLRNALPDDLLAGLYRRCRALLFPSAIEGFGLPVAEALACGAHVIYLARCLSVVEIANGVGTIVPSLEPADWASAMQSAPSEPVNDSQRIRDEFSWDETAQKVQNVLVDLTS